MRMCWKARNARSERGLCVVNSVSLFTDGRTKMCKADDGADFRSSKSTGEVWSWILTRI